MFHSLSYSVTFPSTGRTLSNKLDFTAGFSAITGPNESGKSMIFEMLRFGLFGTQALRGEADDYKNLKMEAQFTIRGDRYKVERTMKKADLWRGDQLVATGVTAVNDKIGKTLGFGRAVFDVACSINQGEVERLGSMTAADRKRLVDSVLGIDALDNVAKWGMEEAKLLERDAATLRQRLVEPQAPELPADYIETAVLRPKLELLQAECTELSTLEGWLSASPTQPARPTCTVSLPVSALTQFAEQRTELRHQVEDMTARIAALPATSPHTAGTLDLVEQLWADGDAYRAAQEWLRDHPRPQFLPQALTIFRDDWVALDRIAHRTRLQDRIDELTAEGSTTCPHCNGVILVEQEEVDRLQADFDAIIVPRDGEIPPAPPIAADKIEAELQKWRDLDMTKYREMDAVPPVTLPVTPRHMIPTHRAEIDQVAERAVLLCELGPKQTSLKAMPDYEKMLTERRVFEEAEKNFASANMAYQAWQADKVVKEARRRQLDGVHDRYGAMVTQYQTASTYETAQAAWRDAHERFVSEVRLADDLEAKAAEHRKVRDVMNVLRSLIKQHILPSLNKVASHLLSGMTGGVRNIVVIDEDFNILVDNQDIQTLSGSGKSVANLALRIALGQVLTNRVISVLLADEIDASMDENRAELTSLVLRTLELSISQVMLVSHKSVEADNRVELGDFSGPSPDHD